MKKAKTKNTKNEKPGGRKSYAKSDRLVEKSEKDRFTVKKKKKGDQNDSFTNTVSLGSSETKKLETTHSTRKARHRKEKVPAPEEVDLTPKISPECLQAVDKAVLDFFDTAWAACAERFFVSSASVTATFELRNTWLQILEMEWLEMDLKPGSISAPGNVVNKTFLKDDPPLPLAFDTWSRGTLETLPRTRAESVLDPFLRDVFRKNIDRPEEEEVDESREGSQEDSDSGNERSSTPEQGTVPIGDAFSFLGAALTSSSFTGENEGDTWNFDLENASSPSTTFIEEEPSPKDESSSPPVVTEQRNSTKPMSPEKVPPKVPFHAILPPRLILNRSKVEMEVEHPASVSSTPGHSGLSGIESVIKFSLSQFGGNRGSQRGVFRLFHETTSEALARRRQMEAERDQEFREEAGDGPVAKSSMTNDSTNIPSITEMVVPLFHEWSPSVPESSDETLPEVIPSTEIAMESASDTNRQFINRNKINLHRRLQRQVERCLASRKRAPKVKERKDCKEKDKDKPEIGEFVTKTPSAHSSKKSSNKSSSGLPNRQSEQVDEDALTRLQVNAEITTSERIFAATTNLRKPSAKPHSNSSDFRFLKTFGMMGNVRQSKDFYRKSRFNDKDAAKMQALNRYETTHCLGRNVGYMNAIRPGRCPPAGDNSCSCSIPSRSQIKCSLPKT